MDKITSTELSKYRLQKAEKMLSSAKRDVEDTRKLVDGAERFLGTVKFF